VTETITGRIYLSVNGELRSSVDSLSKLEHVPYGCEVILRVPGSVFGTPDVILRHVNKETLLRPGKWVIESDDPDAIWNWVKALRRVTQG
jgi:hypothetical protein